jgi:SAM-dependent methyltransferase
MKRQYEVLRSSESWDTYWGSVDVKENLQLCRGDEILPIFRRYLRSEQLILEAGCGLAKWVIYFAEEGYRIVGLDKHQASLERAKAFYGDLVVTGGSVAELPFPDGSLDAYISLGVIEHFEEGPARALSEAHRVLRQGGIAIIETPYDNVLRRLVTNHIMDAVRITKQLLGGKYRFAEYRFTQRELRSFVRKAGFRILAVHPKDYDLPEKSIGLTMDVPILRERNGTTFELNASGRLAKRVLFGLSPWLFSACVVCVAQKA